MATATRRRIRIRETEVACGCGASMPVRFGALVYVRLTRDRPDAAELWETDCGACGEPLPVTVGDAHRAT